MSTRSAVSLWDVSAQETDVRSEFVDGTSVDVAVVGGGFTGLSTALHCAQKGLSVHVLEAEQIGFGGSGRNCGLVNAALWLPPQLVREQLGTTFGPRFLSLFGSGPEKVFSTIEKYQIRCEATKTGTIHAAHAPSGFKDLQGRHLEWQRLGEPVDLLTAAEVQALTGTDVFHGGLLDHRAGTINPMSYCRGLARAALGEGAVISTGVRATSLDRKNGKWLVSSNQGQVTADKVVLGTNAYTDNLWPNLSRIFTIIHYFQLATEPLDAGSENILPNRQGVWDTGQIMFNVRRDAHDRILLGSMGTIIGTIDKGLSQRWALKQLARLFPQLGPVKFESAWHGKIAMTPDHLPRIYELDTDLFTTIGYNGRGITTGTLFGETLSELFTGMAKSELPLPVTEMRTVSTAPLKSRLFQGAFTANQILKSL